MAHILLKFLGNILPAKTTVKNYSRDSICSTKFHTWTQIELLWQWIN